MMSENYFCFSIPVQHRSSRLINIPIGEILMRMQNEQNILNTTNEVWKAPGKFESNISILDDLSLDADSEAEVKAGCIGCSWGGPLTNHNQTIMKDAEADVQLADLNLSDEEMEIVKGGHGVSVLAYARVDGSALR
jgi:hypothetical protein